MADGEGHGSTILMLYNHVVLVTSVVRRKLKLTETIPAISKSATQPHPYLGTKLPRARSITTTIRPS